MKHPKAINWTDMDFLRTSFGRPNDDSCPCAHWVSSVCTSPLCRQNIVPGRRGRIRCTDTPDVYAGFSTAHLSYWVGTQIGSRGTTCSKCSTQIYIVRWESGRKFKLWHFELNTFVNMQEKTIYKEIGDITITAALRCDGGFIMYMDEKKLKFKSAENQNLHYFACFSAVFFGKEHGISCFALHTFSASPRKRP